MQVSLSIPRLNIMSAHYIAAAGYDRGVGRAGLLERLEERAERLYVYRAAQYLAERVLEAVRLYLVPSEGQSAELNGAAAQVGFGPLSEVYDR